MNLELIGALNELERERGISKEILLEAIEAAITSAYKRNDQAAQNVRVEVSDKSGRIYVYAQKEVVEEVFDSSNEVSLESARALDPNYTIGDIVEVDVTPKDFGRIAAQTAKQVVIQRIREAERSLIYEEYSNRVGDVVTGIVQRSDYRNVLVDLGKVEAILPPNEQIQRENYSHGTRLKVYISEVRQTTKGPQVVVSRSHPGLLKRLFELEVPEIHDGVVEIKAVAREAGNRSKIAVISRDTNVDPVGACVGPRGMRVQTVVEELKGEKIDIVEFSLDPERFIGNALSPARAMRVFVNEDEKSARAVVPDHQLSLAIGREGQNARLAARLTGWKIDIKSETQMAELARLEAERALDTAAEKPPAADGEVDLDEVLIDDGFDHDDVTVEDGIEEPVTPPAVATSDVATYEVEHDDDIDEVDGDDPGSDSPILDDEAVVIDHDPGEIDAADDADDIVEPEDDAADLAIPVSDLLVELEEPEDIPIKEPDDIPKPKRTRASKKAELKDLLEEDVFVEEDDEDLPSLFEAEDEPVAEVDEDEPVVFVVDGTSDDQRDGKSKDDASKDRKKPKDKLVLKDLSELKSLLDAVEKDKE